MHLYKRYVKQLRYKTFEQFLFESRCSLLLSIHKVIILLLIELPFITFIRLVDNKINAPKYIQALFKTNDSIVFIKLNELDCLFD